jgi:hypothetical protein
MMNAQGRETKARSHRTILSTAFALLLGATSGSYALVLSGSIISGAGTYSISDLQNNFAPVTETVGGVTYVGASLWTFLGGEPNLQHPSCPTCNTNPNQFLRNYLVATGAGEGTSLVSIGDINGTARCSGRRRSSFRRTRPACAASSAWPASRSGSFLRPEGRAGSRRNSA